jgi:hypothetical protein
VDRALANAESIGDTGRRLKARRSRRSAACLQAARVRDALAKTGVAGSLGVMSRRLGPSAVWRAARGEAAASRLCVAPLRAVQGRRSALKRHIGGQAKTSTGLYPSIRGPGNPRGEHNDGNNGAAQGSKPNRGLAPVTASVLLPREDDAVRPQCASSGHSPTAWRMGQIDPEPTFKVRPLNGR